MLKHHFFSKYVLQDFSQWLWLVKVCFIFLDPEKEQEQLYDSDDEFILEKNQFTTKVLSSVLPDDGIQPEAESDTDDEEGDDEIPHPDFDAGRSVPPPSLSLSLTLSLTWPLLTYKQGGNRSPVSHACPPVTVFLTT